MTVSHSSGLDRPGWGWQVRLGVVPYADLLPGRVDRVPMEVQALVVSGQMPSRLPKEFLERVAAKKVKKVAKKGVTPHN